MMHKILLGTAFIVLFAATARADGAGLSRAERDSFRAQVAACWTLHAASKEARHTKVVVSAQLRPDGMVVADSVRLLRSSDASKTARTQAFDAARRAIMRCGVAGYTLSRDTYDQWKSIELTFDPERTP